MRSPALALGLGLCFAVVPAAADTPIVFHSATGTAPGEVLELTGQDELVLWFDAGSDTSLSGTPCVDGDGDETCGFDVAIELEGNGHLSGFAPSGPAIFYWPESFGPAQKSLRLNWLDVPSPQSPPVSVPLGTLSVDTSDGGGSVVRVTGVERVDAALQLEPIASAEIARTTTPLPEPGALLQLVAGCGLLAALRRRHRTARCDAGP